VLRTYKETKGNISSGGADSLCREKFGKTCAMDGQLRLSSRPENRKQL